MTLPDSYDHGKATEWQEKERELLWKLHRVTQVFLKGTYGAPTSSIEITMLRLQKMQQIRNELTKHRAHTKGEGEGDEKRTQCNYL